MDWPLTEATITRAISFETNSQITGRIGLSWDGVADSLPGVAIAISLVSLLCVVGIGLAESEVDAALGATLLFLTNLSTIFLAGGILLVLLGLSAATMSDLEQECLRRAFLLIAIGVLLITIPLGATSIRVFKQNLIRRVTMRLAKEWVEGTGFNISQVDVSGDQVDLVIYGSSERPRLSELGDQMGASLV